MKGWLITGIALLSMGVWAASTLSPQDVSIKKGLNGQDKNFIRQASYIHLGEVQLGKLAQKRGKAAWVRQFGWHMVVDHGGAQKQLRKIARAKRMSAPTKTDAKHRSLYARLSRLRGTAFDAAYQKVMIQGHSAAEQVFTKEVRRGNDGDVENYAYMVIPDIQHHKRMAEMKQGKM